MVGGTWQMVEKTWALPLWSPAIVKMMRVDGRHSTSLPKRKAGNRNVVLVVVMGYRSSYQYFDSCADYSAMMVMMMMGMLLATVP